MARAKSPSRSPSPAFAPRKHQNTVPARPPLRSNFDLEPNPFEQSFASTSTASRSSLSSLRDSDDPPRPSARPFASPNESNLRRKSPSASSTASHHSRKHSNDSVASSNSLHPNDTPKPVLPPLASITSPSEQSYPWAFSAGIANSLRSGPLSPAMLAGPQPQQQSASTAVSAPLFGYDPSGTFRTGLTPSTGLTPLVGGPVAFPPPSPNTAAAFYAMVNSGSAMGSNASTITPNTLSALAGVLQANPPSSLVQSSAPQQAQPSTAAAANSSNAATATAGGGTVAAFEGPTSQSSRYASSYPPQSNTQSKSQSLDQSSNYSSDTGSTNAAANGLFLLSQAHQELAKREEAEKQSQQSQSNGKRGSKRKNESATPVSASTAPSNKPAQSSKRTRMTSQTPSVAPNTRTAAARRGSAAASLSTSAGGDADMDDPYGDDDEEDDDMGGDDGDGGSSRQAGGQKKPETEEEKRKNFLERNRQGALSFTGRHCRAHCFFFYVRIL